MSPRAEKPLHQRHIVVTRASAQAHELVEALRSSGARVTSLPCIRIEPAPGAVTAIRDALTQRACNWLFFTSANAATELGKWRRQLAPVLPSSVAAIGSKTAEAVRAAGFAVHFEAKPGTAADFVAQFIDAGHKARRIFYPASANADERLETLLARHGIALIRVDLYRTVAAVQTAEVEPLVQKPPDAIVFYSPSAVQAFFAALPEGAEAKLAPTLFAAIGPTTRAALERVGARCIVAPEQPATEGLVALLAQHFTATPAARPKPAPPGK